MAVEDLGDDELAARLAARGVTDDVVDRLVADRDDPYVITRLDRFLGNEEEDHDAP